MNNNNNKKYASKVLHRKSFELNANEVKILCDALNGCTDKEAFKRILVRYRQLKYHIK